MRACTGNTFAPNFPTKCDFVQKLLREETEERAGTTGCFKLPQVGLLYFILPQSLLCDIFNSSFVVYCLQVKRLKLCKQFSYVTQMHAKCSPRYIINGCNQHGLLGTVPNMKLSVP